MLLDVMMPRMDGFEVCRQLKANRRTCDVPVVMVTALSDTANRLRGLVLVFRKGFERSAPDLAIEGRRVHHQRQDRGRDRADRDPDIRQREEQQQQQRDQRRRARNADIERDDARDEWNIRPAQERETQPDR